ncbi:MAG: hypothetical protein AAF624_12985 [Bacteroidota bacterium]
MPVTLSMPRPQDSIQAALERAREAAWDVVGNYTTPPWRFHVLTAAASALTWAHAHAVEQRQGADVAAQARLQWGQIPGWVLVTCARAEDPQGAEHVQERSLTAVQRFSLSLWAEDLHTRWAQPDVMDTPAVAEQIDMDPASEFVIGVLWFSEDADLLPPPNAIQAV